MSESKKENLFAKLAQQNRAREETAGPPAAPGAAPPSPAPPAPEQKRTSAASRPETAKGKRNHPDYCQANAYVPRSLRKAVDKALLDVDGLDYSTLVTDLLRQWIKSRGVSE